MRSLATLLFLLSQTAGEKELERLKELASKAETPAAKAAAGDAYISAGAKFGKDRSKFVEGAMALYQDAWASIEDAPKEKLRERLNQLAGYRDDWEKRGRGLAVPAGWTGFAETAGSYVDTAFFRSGKKSARLSTWKDPAGRNSWMTTTKFKVQPGKEFQLFAHVFSARASEPAELQVRFYDDANKALLQVGPAIEADLPVWKAYTGAGTSPAGSVWADVCLWSTLKSGAFWIDDVSLKCDGKELLKNGGFEEK